MIISSARLLNLLIATPDFLTHLSTILKRGGKIKVLSNELDTDITNKFNFINSLKLDGIIEYKCSNQIDRFNELVVLCDSKSMIRLNLDISSKQTVYFSSEQSAIAVQEILFEKYWNEVKSLEITNN